MVSVAGLKPVRLQDSSPLVVLSRERLPMMLEFLRSDHEPFLSVQGKRRSRIIFVFHPSGQKIKNTFFLFCPATK